MFLLHLLIDYCNHLSLDQSSEFCSVGMIELIIFISSISISTDILLKQVLSVCENLYYGHFITCLYSRVFLKQIFKKLPKYFFFTISYFKCFFKNR